jgi:hypothetical protein
MLPARVPLIPWNMTKIEKAPDATERVQWNSFKRDTKKIEKEYQTAYVRARVMKLTPTTDQAKLEVDFRFIRKPLENNIRLG